MDGFCGHVGVHTIIDVIESVMQYCINILAMWLIDCGLKASLHPPFIANGIHFPTFLR